jgi:hypothetical protein
VTENFVESPAEPATDFKQIVAAVILGIAATLTALSAYNAALADGNALQGYTTSSLRLNDANAFYAQGNVAVASDQSLFIQYAVASQEGQTDLATYLTTLMRPEMQQAVEWWIATDEALTPFDEIDGNPYAVPDFIEASDLEAEADALFQEGSDEDSKGDKFELAVVLFALALFFGGIATLFRKASVSTALLVMAAVTVSAGAVRLITAF